MIEILPFDVLSLIFLALYQSKPNPFPPHHYYPLKESYQHRLLALKLVCKAWDRLIDNTPALWTFVWVVRSLLRNHWYEDQESEEWLDKIRMRLRKSGSLPLEIVVMPDKIVNVEAVAQLLGEESSRWERIDIVFPLELDMWPTQIPTSYEDITLLLSFPMPNLKSIHLGSIASFGNEQYVLPIDANLPSLSRLSCTGHIIIPQSAPLLTHVYLEEADLTSIPLTATTEELRSVAEIRITRSRNIREILSAFVTPSLRTLVIADDEDEEEDDDGGDEDVDGNIHPVLTLPTYYELRELHWEDGTRSRRTLEYLLSKCPNLRCLSNYIQVPEREFVANPSTIPSLIVSRDSLSSTDPLCPALEEVCFDAATCCDVERLVTSRPSIKRVRFLSDPRGEASQEASDMELEKQSFERLKERVDVAIWTEPWQGGRERM